MKKSQSESQRSLQYFKAVTYEVPRGQQQHCDLCLKEFKLIVREHQCKRCRRAVCETCSAHKAVIMGMESKGSHRQCYFCKQEQEQMRKFILDNQIKFLKDSVSVDWLTTFSLDVELAKLDYKKCKYESSKMTLNFEVQQMNQQVKIILAEIDQYVSYSLRDFFYLASKNTEKDIIEVTIINIITVFLQKYPQVGWNTDLVIITYFFLCLASESSAYELLTILYGSILPPYLYIKQSKAHEYANEVDMMTRLADQGIKIQSAEINNIKYFLQNRVARYISTLSLNFMLFESTYFVISQAFLGGAENGYFDFLRALISVISLQSQQIKKANVNYDESELSVLRNARSEQASGFYLQTRKIHIELQNGAEEVKQRGQSIHSRSVTIALQKLETQKSREGELENSLLEAVKKNEESQAVVVKQQQRMEKLEKEKKEAIAAKQLQYDDYTDMKEQYETLLLNNQTLLLDKMKRDSEPSGASSQELVELQKKVENLTNERTNIAAQNDSKTAQLDSSQLETLQIREQLEQQIKDNEAAREVNEALQLTIIELETQTLKLNQQMEILKMQESPAQDQEDNHDSAEPQKLNLLLIQKNEEILLLTEHFHNEQGKSVALQRAVAKVDAQLVSVQSERDAIRKENANLNHSLEQLNNQILQTKMESSGNTMAAGGETIKLVLKDLEDGKNLLERKNNDIIQLRQQAKEKDDQISSLQSKVKQISQTMEEQEVQSKDFFVVMRRATQLSKGAQQLDGDFELLLEHSDPEKRSAARNIKSKMDVLEKEVLFRQTQAQIMNEQLQPFREKNRAQEQQIKELENRSEQMQLMLSQVPTSEEEPNKTVQSKQPVTRERVQSVASTMSVKPRIQIKELDPEVMNQNSSACSESCIIF